MGPHYYLKKQQREIMNMSLKSSLRCFCSNGNRVITRCIVNENFKKTIRPNFFFFQRQIGNLIVEKLQKG